MLQKIWEIINTFTDETYAAAAKRSEELGFDVTSGIISLAESFINLDTARHILSDVIEKEKLIQLPISIQKILLQYLQDISRFLTSLINGTNEIKNLTNSIEQLNTAIWQYGLQNLSDEVLGYQTKMNQLKNHLKEIYVINRQLKIALEQKEKLENLLNLATNSVDRLDNFISQSDEKVKKIEENLKNTTMVTQEAEIFLKAIQENDTTIKGLLSNTKISSSEIVTIEKRIQEFYQQIDAYKASIESSSKKATDTVTFNNEKTEELFTKLQQLEDEIKDKLVKATGYSLFNSFNVRKDELKKSANLWLCFLFLLVAVSICCTIYIIYKTTSINLMLLGKISLAIPLIYAISFCTIQYGRERRLEEEYAFRSNISISLEAYRGFIEKLIDNEKPDERAKFTAFIIDAIDKIYTSPTEKLSDKESLSNQTDALQRLEKILGAVLKPLNPLINIIKK